MILTITEVQITFVIIMGLCSLVLAFSLPRITSLGKVYNMSRRLLVGGTLLVSAHFAIQYLIHKHTPSTTEIRTFINLIFGLPTSFFFCLSLLNLQRHGLIKKWEWMYIPVIITIALISIFFNNVILKTYLHTTNLVLAFLYGIELFINAILLIKGHFDMIRSNNYCPDNSSVSLIRWIKWSTFMMIIVSLGFPIVIFNTNLLVRSLYGLLTLAPAFLYIFSFIGYGLSCNVPPVPQQTKAEEKPSLNSDLYEHEGQVLNEFKFKQVVEAVNSFIEDKAYLQPEITLKEAADQMHISCNMLRIWLRTTEYEKFTNWITALRITYAKKLFTENPNISSEEVASACGFCSRQYFQSQFSKYEGITPAKWIKENLLNIPFLKQDK